MEKDKRTQPDLAKRSTSGKARTKPRKLTWERVWRCYQYTKSFSKTAKLMGTSKSSIYRIIKAHDTDPSVIINPIGKYDQGDRAEYACISLWLQNNPGVKLPRSYEKISKLTGCSIPSIKGYFHRRGIKFKKTPEKS